MLISFAELAVIIFLSGIIVERHPKAGRIVNTILILLYSIQQVVLRYGTSYVTMIMLTNLASIEDLGGRSTEYIISAVGIVIASLLPITSLHFKKHFAHTLLTISLAMELVLVMTFGGSCSPLYGYAELAASAVEANKQEKYIQSLTDSASDFYQEEVENYVTKPANITEKPNVILIFTEGLSQQIVDDERNIMPNVRTYEENSLNFINYYNHTAATYRGLIGQLFSGYQNHNLDHNGLVSIQSIFKNYGYYTSFINVEPNNEDFTEYLNDLGFDDVIQRDTENAYTTDKEAYEDLFDTAEQQASEGQPFFTAIYTFNTHVSLDSSDEIFGDGSDAELNKFYNCDQQFGSFMEKFNDSDLADNTIVIFTADHCTYADDAFRSAFPNVERGNGFLDSIPFFIYYKGLEPLTVDAYGRNSLCLTPTILDYLDMTGENYFLGKSLFMSVDNDFCDFDTVYTTDGEELYSTRSNVIQTIDEIKTAELQELLAKYFAAALNRK
jgi:membrane-anchored protein YejM (alkaline phosphatase superfamily)